MTTECTRPLAGGPLRRRGHAILEGLTARPGRSALVVIDESDSLVASVMAADGRMSAGRGRRVREGSRPARPAPRAARWTPSTARDLGPPVAAARAGRRSRPSCSPCCSRPISARAPSHTHRYFRQGHGVARSGRRRPRVPRQPGHHRPTPRHPARRNRPRRIGSTSGRPADRRAIEDEPPPLEELLADLDELVGPGGGQGARSDS